MKFLPALSRISYSSFYVLLTRACMHFLLTLSWISYSCLHKILTRVGSNFLPVISWISYLRLHEFLPELNRISYSLFHKFLTRAGSTFYRCFHGVLIFDRKFCFSITLFEEIFDKVYGKSFPIIKHCWNAK